MKSLQLFTGLVMVFLFFGFAVGWLNYRPVSEETFDTELTRIAETADKSEIPPMLRLSRETSDHADRGLR